MTQLEALIDLKFKYYDQDPTANSTFRHIKIKARDPLPEAQEQLLLEEIARFNSDKIVNKDMETRFKESMKYEYDLLESFKPSLLLVDRSGSNTPDESKKVFIDPVRLKNEGSSYLQELTAKEQN